jgi:hypothetical protein
MAPKVLTGRTRKKALLVQRTSEPTPTTGRAAVPALMERARDIAKAGSCAGFGHVMRLIGDGGLTLKLWADATQRDEIDRLCAKARDPLRSSRARIKRTH